MRMLGVKLELKLKLSLRLIRFILIVDGKVICFGFSLNIYRIQESKRVQLKIQA